MRESTEYRPTPALAEPAIPLTAPAGHGSLGANGYKLLTSWEGVKSLYRVTVVSSVRAWHQYYTLLTAPDPDQPDVAAGPRAFAAYAQQDHPITGERARELARRYAIYEAVQPIVSMARMYGRLAWGDDAEATLYSRLYDETLHAAHAA